MLHHGFQRCDRPSAHAQALVHSGIHTFACSETQKFGHVTFFWNGNRSGMFDPKLETYLEVRFQAGLPVCL
jgi:2,3-bisphosphoglycerate-independent phosphoglycerate mutase